MVVRSLAAFDLNLLTALEALLRTESVTQAARELNLGQPAVSHALGRLREELSDPLLVRAGRHMVRTPRGDALAPQVTDLLAQIRRTLVEPDDFDPKTYRGELHVAAGDYAIVAVLHGWAQCLLDEVPGLDLRLQPIRLNSGEALERGELDMIVTPAVTANLARFRTTRLCDDHFQVVFNKQHGPRGELTAERYAGLKHVVVASGRDPRSMVDRALAELGLERRVAMTVPSYLSMLPALLRSELVGTLPSKLFVAGGPALEFREPPVALPDIELTLAWHARLDADPRQVWLRESLRQYVRDTFGESN